MAHRPFRCCDDAAAKPRDVESKLRRAHVDAFLGLRQQVEQQRRVMSRVQVVGDLTIAAAEAAAAAAMRKDDHAACVFGKVQIRVEEVGAVGDPHCIDHHAVLHVTPPSGTSPADPNSRATSAPAASAPRSCPRE